MSIERNYQHKFIGIGEVEVYSGDSDDDEIIKKIPIARYLTAYGEATIVLLRKQMLPDDEVAEKIKQILDAQPLEKLEEMRANAKEKL